MAKETVVYSETLRDLAQKGDIFYLDTTTLRFTLDMIGRTISCVRLCATLLRDWLTLWLKMPPWELRRDYNVLADCMLSQIRWHQPNAESNPLGYFNVARWCMQWWNT